MIYLVDRNKEKVISNIKIHDMNQHNITRYLNGFIIGFVFGALLIFVGMTLYNLYCSLQSCPPMAYTFWNLASFPLLVGISMAIFVANYTLRD